MVRLDRGSQTRTGISGARGEMLEEGVAGEKKGNLDGTTVQSVSVTEG